jgi:IclR family acetate operon transcriptional repressor
VSSSAKRALKILGAVGEAGRPMGVTEIARALEIAPGTAFRGLDALSGANLLARHPAAPRYVLGPAAHGLRQSLLSQFRIREVAWPYLRQLASASGESTSLHVRIGWLAARIATAPGTAEVTNGVSLDGAQLLSADIAGRAILAYLGRPQVARFLAWANARGIVIPDGLQRELSTIRARGFASGKATEPQAVAYPIRKADQAFAAILVEGSGLGAPAVKVSASDLFRGAAGALEALVRANPALSRQPFDHIDPDDLLLPS